MLVWSLVGRARAEPRRRHLNMTTSCCEGSCSLVAVQTASCRGVSNQRGPTPHSCQELRSLPRFPWLSRCERRNMRSISMVSKYDTTGHIIQTLATMEVTHRLKGSTLRAGRIFKRLLVMQDGCSRAAGCRDSPPRLAACNFHRCFHSIPVTIKGS